jgi:predicted amidophosphoribosyltransferase
MIIHKQAVGDDCAHKVEILCPNCSRDVDESELFNKTCNDCGASLNAPQQSVEIHATSVAAVAITF